MKAFKDLEAGEGIYLESKTEWRAVYKSENAMYLVYGSALGELPDPEYATLNWPTGACFFADAFDYWKKWVAKREFHTVEMFFSKQGHIQLVHNWKKNHIARTDKDFLKELDKL